MQIYECRYKVTSLWMIWILEDFPKIIIFFCKICVSKRLFSTEDEIFFVGFEKKHRKYLGTPFTNLTHRLCIQIQAIFTHVFISRHLHYISFLYIKIESVTGLFEFLICFHPLKKCFTSFVMWKSLYRNLVHFRVYIFLLIFLTILRTFRFGETKENFLGGDWGGKLWLFFERSAY